jgi:hypothetical protein
MFLTPLTVDNQLQRFLASASMIALHLNLQFDKPGDAERGECFARTPTDEPIAEGQPNP